MADRQEKAHGVALGNYTTTGLNPLYGNPAPPRLERVFAQPDIAVNDEGAGLTDVTYRPGSRITADTSGDALS